MKTNRILISTSLMFVMGLAAAHAQALLSQGAGGQAPSPSHKLTLQQAVELALENNPTVQAADAYAEGVRHGIAVARAGRYPRLDFSESFTRGNNPVYVFGSLLTQRQFTARNFDLALLNVPPPLDNFRTQFSASMPLYDFGRTARQIHDARLDSESAGQARRRTRQEVIFNVIEAYLNELLARESVRVSQAAVEMTKADLARAQARQEQGLTVPSDVLSAQVQLAQAQEDLIRAQNAGAIAHAALNVAMGFPEDAPTEIEGGLGEVAFEVGELAGRQERALTVRPDYLQAGLGKQRAVNGERLARSEFLPQLDVFGSWEQDNQTFLARGGNNWTVGASLNFNLFDGGANRARLAQSHARRRQAEALAAQMASAVRFQVREAFLNLKAAGERVEVSREAAAQAEESLRIIQNRYEAGLTTITDLLRAETAHTSARKNFLNAIFDYRVSFAALELATGELGPASQAVTR
ncbi:MAG: TolC family protein [Acidobacteria bacterium]|nr:TolC family protein [Acidobacteriota bacterium]